LSELVVSRIGEGPTNEGSRVAYLVARPGGAGVVRCCVGESDATALQEAERAVAGHEVVCEPALAEVAATRHWRTRELDEGERIQHAHAAVALFCDDPFDQIKDPAALLDFFDACVRLQRAVGTAVDVWRGDIQLAGELAGERIDAGFSGLLSREPFMVTFAEPSLMAEADVGRRKLDDVARIDVPFQSTPESVRRALRDAYELDAVPLPYFTKDRKKYSLDQRTLSRVTIVLYAIRGELSGLPATVIKPIVGGSVLAQVGNVSKGKI